MTLLVGVSNETGYTNTATGFGGANRAWWRTYAAVASGTANKLHIKLYGTSTSTAVKLCLWSNAGTLLANTAAISIVDQQWVEGSISDVSIESGTSYRLGWVSDGYFYPYTDSSTWAVYYENDSYATPGDVGAGTNDNKSKALIWAESSSTETNIGLTGQSGNAARGTMVPSISVEL